MRLVHGRSTTRAKTIDDIIEIAVQINGKLRGTIMLPRGASKEDAVATVKADERIVMLLDGKTIVKEIYVPEQELSILSFVDYLKHHLSKQSI